MEKLNSIEEFDQTLKQDGHMLLLKHSSTCPISAAAYQEYEKFAREHEDLKSYYLVVQDSRPLSSHIAEKYQIKHESPQAILFSNHGPIWDTSHWEITEKNLDEIWQVHK